MASSDQLRDRQTDLIKILSALDQVLKSEGWQTLKELVFDKEEARIEKLLLSEAKSDEPSLKALHKLQGELLRIRRYDLKSYADMCVKELQGIKDNLQ